LYLFDLLDLFDLFDLFDLTYLIEWARVRGTRG